MSLEFRVIPVTPFEQNCTLVWCTESMQAAVIDPGGDLETVLGIAAEAGVTIERVLLTHGHVDHAGATAELAERTGVPIEGPNEADKYWIDAIETESQKFGFGASRVFTPNRWLTDGDVVAVGNQQLEVIHCPGHTPGHVVFFARSEKVAQVGDVLFQGSVGRTDFPGGDSKALIHSIRKKLFPLGDDVTFIPGHGPVSTFGDERRHNPYVGDNAVF